MRERPIPVQPYRAYDFFKRVFDTVCVILVMIPLLPFFIIISLLIKLESEGSVFFYQTRLGKGGRAFHCYKFRTMVMNAKELEAQLQTTEQSAINVNGVKFSKIKNDPRITRVGHYLRAWSLDELPQLLNILFGDMSFIGPRPLPPHEHEVDLEWKNTRLSVLPGMTGLWQIMARDSCEVDDFKRFDTEYVKKRSFWLDLKILLKTPHIVARKGSKKDSM